MRHKEDPPLTLRTTDLDRLFLNLVHVASLTSVFAVGQKVFGHLVAPTHVVLIGLRHSELADRNQWSAWRKVF